MKHVIVTGAAGNMGQAIVKKFIAEGYQVTGTVIPGDPATIDLPGDRFEKTVIDLMNEDACGKFVATTIEKYGSIDAAVLTVGGFAIGDIAATSAQDILKQYQLNFQTAYHVARPLFIQMLKKNNGRIFLTGSRPGIDARDAKGMVAYGLAKSLIFRLAEIMNEEAKGYNVVVTVVIPGTIDTPQNRNALPTADRSRWVTPEQIAGTIFYHCSDEAIALRETLIKVYGNS